MTKNKSARNKRLNRNKSILTGAAILFVLVGIPFLLLNYQAKRSGLTMSEVIKRTIGRSDAGGNKSAELDESIAGVKVDFLDPLPIGNEFSEAPLIAHIQAVDLDDDKIADVIICDDRRNSV